VGTMMINELINKRVYEFSNRHEVIEIVVYGFIGFLIPMLLGHPQLLVGSIVNSVIILSALHHRGVKPVSLFILPSLGAITRGILFGPFTILLVYMAPFIWISNFLIWITMKKLYIDLKKNYLSSLIISSMIKASFLFLTAFLLYSLGIIPKLFLIAMGPIQLATAITGGLISLSVSKGIVYIYSRKE